MFIPRTLANTLLFEAKQYPVVTLIGPRQSGKSTLVKQCFPGHHYTNLEAPDIRAWVKEDPRGFLASHPQGLILDEIQQVPELLSYLQTEVDENPTRGRYVLTGSHQLSVSKAISQSLAGRTAVLSLLPLSLEELGEASALPLSKEAVLLRGGFPRLYAFPDLIAHSIHRDYIHTYLERDVRELIQLKNLRLFQTFLRLLAGHVGQIFHRQSLCETLGVSSHTMRHWLSILEASFIIFFTPPYYENVGKRLLKSPKLYFTDVGLACYLLALETEDQVARDPLHGALFENLVMLELYKARLHRGKTPNLYYYRDQQGHEVDAVYHEGNSLTPIEIKSSQTFHPQFLKNLRFFHTLKTKHRVEKSHVIYAGRETWHNESAVLSYYAEAGKVVVNQS